MTLTYWLIIPFLHLMWMLFNMGKGKKAKGKKRRDGKKTKDNKAVGAGKSVWAHPTQEQHEMAVAAASQRMTDPLKSWTRLQNEECPICMLPLPIWLTESINCVICGTTVCMGCVISGSKVHARNCRDLDQTVEKAMLCPCCRTDTSSYDDEAILKTLMKRANAGQHEAMLRIGRCYFHGKMGLQQDKEDGLKWLHRAVEGGSGDAAGMFGTLYYSGDGVEQDDDKSLEYYQKATELGDSTAFLLIGHLLMNKGDIEEGILNLRKAAMCGVSGNDLFSELRNYFINGYITKDEYAFTLRENQKACNEMKSDEREMWSEHEKMKW